MKLFSKRRTFENLVFIVGCPRSGTSWTWGLLSSFKQVEPLLIEDFPSLTKKHSVKEMKTDDGFITTETGIFHWDLTDREIRQGIQGKMERHPNAILLEKTPANALKLNRITALFPKAKIVHVFRDPRAVVNSMLKSKFSSGLKLAKTMKDAIALYRRYVVATERYKNYRKLIRLRYESLYRNPTDELSRVCDFIGLIASSSEIKSVIRENTGKAQTVASNDFRKGKIDSYKNELNNQELLQIEHELADVLEAYGY